MINFVSASSHYIDCGFYHTEQDEMSAVAWLIWDEAGDGANVDRALSQYNGGDAVDTFFLGYDHRVANQEFHVSIRDNNNTVKTATSSQYASAAGVLYHVGFTYTRNDNLIIYINGANDGSIATDDYPIQGQSTYNFHIGARQDNQTERWDGKIFDVRTIYRALTPAEMKILYENRGNDSITGWECWYRMNEGPDISTATTILDLSGNSRNGTTANSPTYQASILKIGR